MDADSDIITAVEPTPGNVPDRDLLPKLITGKPNSVTADKAYDAGPNFEGLAEHWYPISHHTGSPGRPPQAERERPKIERRFGGMKRLHGKRRWSVAGI